MILRHDIKTIQDLYIVTIRGYKPEKIRAIADDGSEHDVTPMNPPGSADWFCDQYGMEYDQENIDDDSLLIIWTDYESDSDRPYDFQVLVTKNGLQEIREFASDNDYEIPITLYHSVDKPVSFGDSNGVVDILRHHDGWVIAF